MESVAAAAVEPLVQDTPCIHCGYNLRGLTAGGMCPECGRAIDESLRGDLLRFANPSWLRRVRIGTALAMLPLILELFVRVDIALLSIGLISSFSFGSEVLLAMVFVNGGSAFFAAMLITAPEPRYVHCSTGISLRQVARTVSFIYLLDPLVVLFASTKPPQLSLLGSLSLGILALIAFLLGQAYIFSLVKRIPHKGLQFLTVGLVLIRILQTTLILLFMSDIILATQYGRQGVPIIRLFGVAMGDIRQYTFWLDYLAPTVHLAMLIWFRKVIGSYDRIS